MPANRTVPPAAVVRAFGLVAAWWLLGVPLAAQQLFISPALPTTLDQVFLQVSFYCGLRVDPPFVEGHTITVVVDHKIPEPPCTPPPFEPVLVSLPLPALPAGGYVVQEFLFGKLSPDTVAFQVAPPGSSLTLLGGRYQVAVAFSRPGVGTPISERASAVRLSDRSGYFWFFDSTNVEVTVKILDGRPVNGHYWVFVASMTDVALTIAVTDASFPFGCSLPNSTTPCLTKTFTSAAGTNQNFIDTQYFADFP
jgi:hypothetical protein